jgi:hypothetical protein
LTCYGARFQTLETVIYNDVGALHGKSIGMARYWEDFLQFTNCESRSANNVDNWDIFWRSLIFNRISTGEYPAPPIYSEYAIKWIASTLMIDPKGIFREGQPSQSSGGDNTSTILENNQFSSSIKDAITSDNSHFQRLYSLLQKKKHPAVKNNKSLKRYLRWPNA